VETKEFTCIVEGVSGRGTVMCTDDILRDYKVSIDLGEIPELMRFEFDMTLVSTNPDAYVSNRITTVIGYGPSPTTRVALRQSVSQCFENTLKFLVDAIYKQHFPDVEQQA
jgi:hypothetical protein